MTDGHTCACENCGFNQIIVVSIQYLYLHAPWSIFQVIPKRKDALLEIGLHNEMFYAWICLQLCLLQAICVILPQIILMRSIIILTVLSQRNIMKSFVVCESKKKEKCLGKPKRKEEN